MSEPDKHAGVDHYGSQYSNFASDVLAEIRSAAFGDDYGQNGWQTADEQDRFIEDLVLTEASRVLDVACGSGGPTLRIAEQTGCSIVGIDLHEDGVAVATKNSADRDLADQATFRQADAAQTLEFADDSFDGVICVDAINHLADRAAVLSEFARILKPGGRLVYTDPIVVTGWLTDREMRIRSSIGFFLFFPRDANEQLLERTGFEILSVTDRTENMATMAARWHAERAARETDLRRIEGDDAFDGQQTFFEVAARLARERRLSRLAFAARKRQ